MTTMTDKPLQGKRIVITGKLNCLRAEAIMALERLGATVTNTVTYGTDMVLLGDKVGMTKMNKVRQYGIKTIVNVGQVKVTIVLY